MSEWFEGIHPEKFTTIEGFLEAMYEDFRAAIEHKLMSADMYKGTEALYYSKYDRGFGDRITLEPDGEFCMEVSHIYEPDTDEEEDTWHS